MIKSSHGASGDPNTQHASVFYVLCAQTESYTYYGTSLDNMDHLDYETNHRTGEITTLAAQFAGQMALRLVHDHVLNLDVSRYNRLIRKSVAQVYRRVKQLSQVGCFFMFVSGTLDY